MAAHEKTNRRVLSKRKIRQRSFTNERWSIDSPAFTEKTLVVRLRVLDLCFEPQPFIRLHQFASQLDEFDSAIDRRPKLLISLAAKVLLNHLTRCVSDRSANKDISDILISVVPEPLEQRKSVCLLFRVIQPSSSSVNWLQTDAKGLRYFCRLTISGNRYGFE